MDRDAKLQLHVRFTTSTMSIDGSNLLNYTRELERAQRRIARLEKKNADLQHKNSAFYEQIPRREEARELQERAWSSVAHGVALLEKKNADLQYENSALQEQILQSLEARELEERAWEMRLQVLTEELKRHTCHKQTHHGRDGQVSKKPTRLKRVLLRGLDFFKRRTVVTSSAQAQPSSAPSVELGMTAPVDELPPPYSLYPDLTMFKQ